MADQIYKQSEQKKKNIKGMKTTNAHYPHQINACFSFVLLE